MPRKTSSGNPVLHYLYHYPLTWVCLALIWILCLMPAPVSDDLPTFEGMDKVVHLVMYLGTCSVLRWEYMRRHGSAWSARRVFLFAVLAPITMSLCVEIAQKLFTATRSFDWTDVAANAAGTLLASPVMRLVRRRFPRLCGQKGGGGSLPR